MTHLVDSDWVADWLKGRPQAVQLLSSLGQGNLAISLITFGEIYEGVYFGKTLIGMSACSSSSCVPCRYCR